MLKSLAVVCLAVLAACGSSSNPSPAPSACTPSVTPEPSFATSVMPIFSKPFSTASGTQSCTDCHAAGQDAPSVPFTGSASDTYAVIQKNGLVDTSAPEKSKLYTFPSGLDASHPGGKLFDPTSSDAQTILNWIKDCAPNN